MHFKGGFESCSKFIGSSFAAHISFLAIHPEAPALRASCLNCRRRVLAPFPGRLVDIIEVHRHAQEAHIHIRLVR